MVTVINLFFHSDSWRYASGNLETVSDNFILVWEKRYPGKMNNTVVNIADNKNFLLAFVLLQV
jgi:hypothetical protein